MSVIHKILILICSVIVLNSCGGGGSVSVLPTSDAFDDSDLNFNPKMDILWVVDPSKSMYEEVEKVRSNIQAFITDFITNGYEYRMGVISTSAWSEEAYLANPSLTYLREGSEPLFARLHKGECVDYPNVDDDLAILDHLNSSSLGQFITNFQTNFDVYGVKLGTSGCGLVGPPFGDFSPVPNNIFAESAYDLYRGAISDYINDERPLQSIRAFLDYDKNHAPTRFVRDDAFLAIIIITDEQDASRDSLNPESSYNRAVDANAHSAQDYIDFIENDIKPSGQFAIYSIVDMNISDNIARTAATLSGGVAFDINANTEEYVTNLNSIKDQILVSATAYPLQCPAVENSITVELVKAGGVEISVPKATGVSGGWIYNSLAVTLEFTADYLPAKGDLINVNYTPTGFTCGYGVNQPRLVIDNAEISEGASSGTLVGTVSLINADGTGGVFHLDGDTSTGNAFSLDANTGALTRSATGSIDTEVKANEQVTVRIVLPDATEYDRAFTIRILDVPDSAPVAHSDEYVVSESIVDGSGDVNVIGNVSYNDKGLDSSEAHTFDVVPASHTGTGGILGSLSFNPDGTFLFKVNAASLMLGAGDSYVRTFQYTITDETPTTSAPATVTITVTGENQPPVLSTVIGNRTVAFDNTVVSIPFVAGDLSASGTGAGALANIIAAGGAGFQTSASAGQAHWIEMPFPTVSPFFEVQDFVIDVTSGHSLGNAVLQVLAEDDRVLTREVLPVDESGTSLTIPLASEVIASKVKIIRPNGSMNPAGHNYIDVNRIQVRGIEAVVTSIDLDLHFTDPDGEALTYYATDIYGEGPAPAWVWISGNELRFIPPPGTTNQAVGVLAQDPSGAAAFTTFTITRTGSGTYINKSPLSLLTLSDEDRGGVSLMRFGGTGGGNNVVHIEIDNFIFKPYITLNGGYYDITTDPEQTVHITGDVYGSEVHNGWNSNPVHTDDKYPLSSYSYCNNTIFTGQYGKIIPCINANRSYGEIYSGYFVPAKTGVYKFRTRLIDNTIMLRMAPTEYLEDAIDVFLANWQDTALEAVLQSLAPGIGSPESRNSEFAGQGTGGSFTNYQALGYDTSLFFDMDSITQSRRDGYVHLRQGNVYAFEMRFGEGGGGVHFEFEYNYKEPSCDPTNSDMNNEGQGPCWDGWKALDASVVVPERGSSAYDPQVIGGLGGVSYNASRLFYDPESDALVYSARLVNADGTLYTLGASGTGQLSDIGLTISAQNGILSGTLTNFTTHRPRIIFTATERDV
ncbi:MAG: Ig-like domain-containing protein, partial [Bdellovibrionaceae bacterium]|nr:Ig-like domain-containing protein [Pseudobdellovibrionaceae bacterium]